MAKPVIREAAGKAPRASHGPGSSSAEAPVLRVGFDGRWYNDSGVGTYVAGLLGALAKRQEIGLVVYENPLNLIPGLGDLPVTRVPVSSPRYSLSAQWEFYRRAREDSLHLFHSPFYDVPLLLRCPLVATVHDLVPFLFRIYFWPKQRLVKTGYRLAARKASQIISVSQNTAADIQNLLRVPSERITVVYNGVGQDCFAPYARAGEAERLRSSYGLRPPYFVAASTRNWRTKNLECALRSIHLLQQRTPIKFQTVLYGPPDGFVASGGKDKWRDLDLICLGPVARALLAAVFRHATAFVMPSLYEGFGLPVLEAMSCGCPVVTSNRGALAEIAGSGAQLFDPLDCDGMRHALAGLLDPGTRQLWKTHALKRAAEFSWDNAARETAAVYRRALAEA